MSLIQLKNHNSQNYDFCLYVKHASLVTCYTRKNFGKYISMLLYCPKYFLNRTLSLLNHNRFCFWTP